ncbi:hypothetical protein Sliba_06960 [Streptomyces nigrescens]|uniref:Uncharacterized protein n=1 Tax=Streptomyces nigrescens TaxID=1920 RepID=A0A640T920_STRNI|nr:hypothetical protein Sliba_06960 [Streptomyces libani subsp. libani]GGV86315.1 hypothetical protein GCM10010500_04400 [Streptomyces libani subsp. libani]
MDTAKKKAPSNLASLLRTASYLLSSFITESTVQQVRRRRWRKSDGAFGAWGALWGLAEAAGVRARVPGSRPRLVAADLPRERGTNLRHTGGPAGNSL